MHILHVTRHLPPDDTADALLARQLGEWARESGDTVEYVAHPPIAIWQAVSTRPAPGASISSGGGRKAPDVSGHVTWIPRRQRGVLDRVLRSGLLRGAWRVWRAVGGALARADLVHVHSDGLLPEVAVLLARRAGKPVVLTLYGPEIWYYRRRLGGADLFTHAYHRASAVTFYGERLAGRAREIGLSRRNVHVVYPPVAPIFERQDDERKAHARAELRLFNRHVLLNVSPLRPLAGQRFLIQAMMDIVWAHPDTRLVICGTGPLLEQLKSVARSAGVERHVTFPGLVGEATIARFCEASDLFVLSSLLESVPAAAVEALACGTPLLSTDSPGGLELHDLFGADVSIVPREQPIAMAAATTQFLSGKRRTLAATRDTIERLFRPAAVAAQYRVIYGAALAESCA